MTVQMIGCARTKDVSTLAPMIIHVHAEPSVTHTTIIMCVLAPKDSLETL